MSQPDPTKQIRPWGFASIALLVIGLLIAIPSGLCVGLTAYDLYFETPIYVEPWVKIMFVVGIVVFVFGILSIVGAFKSRWNPDDD